jgi:hypothetical protein
MHGVDAMTISFGRIRAIQVPPVTVGQQNEIERQYREMSRFHDRAMAIKERILDQSRIHPGRYGETINALATQNAAYSRAVAEAQDRLKHLIAELEAAFEGERKRIRPYPQ